MGFYCLSGDQSDLSPELKQLLLWLSGIDGEKYIRVGPGAGDLMAEPLGSLDDADGLVSGPPCQGDSTSRFRFLGDDPRSQVFVRHVGAIG